VDAVGNRNTGATTARVKHGLLILRYAQDDNGVFGSVRLNVVLLGIEEGMVHDAATLSVFR
jgi:hypothetical protein